ncbi:MAG: hypothetical protein ACI8TQ_003334 [Planctomycetota bacterium]|jgi:hypothetical protein
MRPEAEPEFCGAFESMDLRVKISSVTDAINHTVLRLQVSRQPEEYELWRFLEAATFGVQKP